MGGCRQMGGSPLLFSGPGIERDERVEARRAIVEVLHFDFVKPCPPADRTWRQIVMRELTTLLRIDRVDGGPCIHGPTEVVPNAVRVDGTVGKRPVTGYRPSRPTEHARDWWTEAGRRLEGGRKEAGRRLFTMEGGRMDGWMEATRGKGGHARPAGERRATLRHPTTTSSPARVDHRRAATCLHSNVKHPYILIPVYMYYSTVERSRSS